MCCCASTLTIGRAAWVRICASGSLLATFPILLRNPRKLLRGVSLCIRWQPSLPILRYCLISTRGFSCHVLLHLQMPQTWAKRTTLQDCAIPCCWNSTLLRSTLRVPVTALNAMKLGITAPPIHANSLPILFTVSPALVPVGSAFLSARSCRYELMTSTYVHYWKVNRWNRTIRSIFASAPAWAPSNS